MSLRDVLRGVYPNPKLTVIAGEKRATRRRTPAELESDLQKARARYEGVTAAATRGPGLTPHLQKQAESARREMEKLERMLARVRGSTRAGRKPTLAGQEQQFLVFMRDHGKPVTVQELSYAFADSPQAITGFLEGLVKRGKLRVHTGGANRRTNFYSFLREDPALEPKHLRETGPCPAPDKPRVRLLEDGRYRVMYRGYIFEVVLKPGIYHNRPGWDVVDSQGKSILAREKSEWALTALKRYVDDLCLHRDAGHKSTTSRSSAVTVKSIKRPRSGEVLRGISATIVPHKSIRLQARPVQHDVTYKIGDEAEYDSYNIPYLGHITKITKKTITISPGAGEKVRRLSLYEFARRNYRGDVRRKKARNRDFMD